MRVYTIQQCPHKVAGANSCNGIHPSFRRDRPPGTREVKLKTAKNRNTLYIADVQSDSQRAYHELFAALNDQYLYAAPWWLEATCGKNGWDAVIGLDARGMPQTALPFHHTRIRGLAALITPPFTQWVSLIKSETEEETKRSAPLPAFPKTSILDLCLKQDAKLILHDSRIQIALKYSYIIPLTFDPPSIRSGYSEGLRRNIRQAEKDYSLLQSEDIPEFLFLCKQSYGQQKMKPPSWLDHVIPQVYKGLRSHQCGVITLAVSKDKTIAGILTGWDKDTTYYLAGGRTADEQGASAHALLLDHAVHAATARGTTFDFEGSMHPGIANFFQSFGARPTSYWNIRKYRGVGKVWSIFSK